MMRKTLCALAAGWALIGSPGAVVILDSTYDAHGYALAEALAAEPQFRAVFFVDMPGSTGSAVWIGNDAAHGYLLTAAHNLCGEGPVEDFTFTGSDGTDYTGIAAVSYPRYRCRAEGQEREDIDGVDLAIVTLDRPVTGLGRAPVLYGGSGELGQRIVFGGYGRRGTGTSGETLENDSGLAAMATGLVEKLIEGPGDFENFFEAALPKEDGSVENPLPNGTLMEPIDEHAGLVAAGDSGGPCFMELDGSWVLAGINTASTGDTQYGDASTFLRISGRKAWIKANAPVARFVD